MDASEDNFRSIFCVRPYSVPLNNNQSYTKIAKFALHSIERNSNNIMRKGILLLISLLSAVSSISAQQTATPQANHRQQYIPIAMDPALRYGILPDGLTYYIRHNETTKQRADFYIVQNVGAILEEDNQNGLAHFLEHMAFQGTKNFPDKLIINYLESVGVKFGANINAYTSIDETVYNLDAVPTYRWGIVDSALLVLHDWSGFLTLDGGEIDKERGVIREEWRTRNKANRRMWTASLPILYPNSQYAKRNVIGDTAIINNFKYDTLRAYYHKWYRPDQQAIIIVGDVNVDSVEQRIKTMFADIPKRINPVPRPIYPIADNKEPIVALITDPEAKETHIDIDYRHAPLPDRVKASQQGYFISVMQNLVTSMLNDRLDEVTQEANSPFAGAASAYGELVKSRDAFSLYVVPTDGKENAAFDRLLKEAERARRYGFTQSELDRAKADMLSNYEKAYNERNKNENNSYVQEYKRNFLDFEPIPGIEWEYATVENMLPHISIEDVNKMLQSQFFGEENITIEINGPEKLKTIFDKNKVANDVKEMKNLNVTAYVDKVVNQPLVNKTPKAGKINKTTYNKSLGYTQWTLSNGMKVVLKKTDFKQDEVELYAFSNGGLSLEDKVAKLPSAMLASSIVENNGLGNFNAVALRKALAGKIASVNPRISTYDHGLSGSSSVKDFQTMMQLCYLYFTGVRKDDTGYNSIISQYRTALINRAVDPNSAFGDSVNVTVSNHNSRTMPFDTAQLNKVNQADALAFFRLCFSNPANFTVVIVGNIDEQTMKSDILTYLGGLKTGKNPGRWIDRNIRVPKGKVENHFSKELTITKASNFIYYSGEMEPTLQNRLNIQAVKNILGLRYLESLREKEGGTYGVSTRAGISKTPIQQAYLQMSFETDPKMENVLLPMIQSEIDTILAKGPLTNDLQKTKEIMLKNHKESIRENDYWQSVLSTYLQDGYDYETDYESAVNAITAESIKTTLSKIMNQGNRIEVVMMPK